MDGRRDVDLDGDRRGCRYWQAVQELIVRSRPAREADS
jgi:hypothetical protein